jgi:hypothetical protein
MDYVYSTKPNNRNVFHVFMLCPDAQDIKKKHREYKAAPAEENRDLCDECRREIDELLASF